MPLLHLRLFYDSQTDTVAGSQKLVINGQIPQQPIHLMGYNVVANALTNFHTCYVQLDFLNEIDINSSLGTTVKTEGNDLADFPVIPIHLNGTAFNTGNTSLVMREKFVSFGSGIPFLPSKSIGKTIKYRIFAEDVNANDDGELSDIVDEFSGQNTHTAVEVYDKLWIDLYFRYGRNELF